MILATYWVRTKKYIIKVIGNKEYLPINYNDFPFKVSMFRSLVERSFFIAKYKFVKNSVHKQLSLLKNFKKNNLFFKDSINNTDLFIKLNTNSIRYNMFISCQMHKLLVIKKINITTRQISILKKMRLRVYGLYHKKARTYRITNFFLKASNSSITSSWILN